LYNPTATISRLSTSGTLEILENDPTTKRIRGNFQFQADEPLNPAIKNQITGGYFSVEYN
jgi:hypothetical protein